MASLQLTGGLFDVNGKMCSLFARVQDDAGAFACTTEQANVITHGKAFAFGITPLDVASATEATVQGYDYRTHALLRLTLKDGYLTFTEGGVVVVEGLFKGSLSIVPSAVAPVAPVAPTP